MRASKLMTLSFFALFSIYAFGQKTTSEKPLTKMSTGVILGINYSDLYLPPGGNFPSDSSSRPARGTIAPILGLQMHTSPSYNMDIKAAIQVAFRGVSASETEHPKLRNTYIDVEIAPRFRIYRQLYLETGVELNLMLTSRNVYLDGSQADGLGSSNVDYYGNTFHPYLGFVTPFTENLEFAFKWSIPIHSEDYTNLEMKFNYKIFQEYYYPAEKGPKEGRELGDEEIVQLKTGHLVVVLEDKQKEIDNYRSLGKDALALELQNEQAKSRQTIISVFEESFEFCPVYFTTSDQQALLDAGMFNEIVYLDESGAKDPTIRPMTPEFLFARFEDIGPSSGGESVDYSVWYLDKDATEKLQMSGSETTRYKAFIFFDREMKDLRSPFPYKIQQYEYIFIREDYNFLITDINRSLDEHFERIQKIHRKKK